MTQANYADLAFREGQELVTYTHLGPKAKRSFLVDGLDNSVPTKTLWSAITSGALNPSDALNDIPIRMTPHPTILVPTTWAGYYQSLGLIASNNAFMADVITCRAITSTQAIIEVEYAILNAKTQEVNTGASGGVPYCNVAPPYMTVGSSVQMRKISQDVDGNSLRVRYVASGPTTGAYGIVKDGSGSFSNKVANPARNITAQVEFPVVLIRMQRRETLQRNPFDLQGMVNSADIEFSTQFSGNDGAEELVTFPAGTWLCTRVENAAEDNGLTWIVTYEFAVKALIDIPSGSNFVSPATVKGVDQASPWDLNALYQVTNGSVGVDSSSNPLFQPGEVPLDAVPSIFQVYGTLDFNTIFPNLP